MILDVIPVIPPENRPLTTLLNGKKTTRDINNLYRNIIIINARLRMRIEREDPIAIINMDRNDLQHAVDSLFDNASKKNPTLSKQKQPIKSLTDYIKGKSGFFRQNLLGKRVDFSGRSAIVSGPELKLYEVGIPSEIILQIFNPFIVSELIREVDENGVEIEPIATNTKDAKKLILQQDPII
jgi:DNA-directed RNA polymerase subunit beta'